MWEVDIEGCDHIHVLLIFSSHRCSNLFPPLHLNVAPLPKEPFACAESNHRIDDGRTDATVYTVCGGSYRFFLYVIDYGCTKVDECPPGAQDYGFVVAAPARNWSEAEFTQTMDDYVLHFAQANRGGYRVFRENKIIVPYGRTASHEISFRWSGHGVRDWTILADTGGASKLVQRLQGSLDNWPLFAGSAARDDQVEEPLLEGESGNACYMVLGPPGTREPAATLVDMHLFQQPIVRDVASQTAAVSC
jgi:hypothetical protein